MRKGILFTYSIFLIALLLLASALVVKNQQIKIGAKSALMNAVNSVNNRFYNIVFDVIDLDKNGINLALQSRVLPFDYFFKDENSLRIQQSMPVLQAEIDGFIDTINAYAIFASDSNAKTTFDAMTVDFNVIKNQRWGGNQTDLMFNILPFCLQLNEKSHIVSLSQQTSRDCKKAFDMDEIKQFKLDINISNEFDDYNAVSCSFNGIADCPDEAFDPASALPYFELDLNKGLCEKCYFGETGSSVVKGHFNPLIPNSVLIECIPAGGSCASANNIEITILNGAKVEYNGSNEFDLSIETNFNSAVKRFYSLDVNAEVKKFWGKAGDQNIYIIKSNN